MINITHRKYMLLLVLPVVYLLIAGVYLVNYTPFYMSNPDPVYAYLFNGINLASGKMQIGHTDHPGTPIQCFVAGVIFIKHLFNHNTPLYQDVILHAESYLYVISIIITLLFVLTTWYTGHYLFKRTENVILSLLFQLTPLIGVDCMYGQNPQPESFIIMAGMVFMAYLYYHSIYTNTHFKENIGLKQVFIYAVFSGFLVACKYICAPLLLLVLFLLPSVRAKIQYVGLSVLFFLLFITPALSAWRGMVQWVYNLTTHTGIYGSGAEGIINPSEFTEHITALFKEDFYFTFIYVLLTVSLLIALVKRKHLRDHTLLMLLSGVWVSTTVLMLLVAKHYSFRYMLPAKLCYPLTIVGFYKIYSNSFKMPKRVYSILFYVLAAFLICLHLQKNLVYLSQPTSYAVSDFFKKQGDEPIIISADFQSARIESSLDFGALYSSDLHFKYWQFLKKIYPHSYLYKQHEDIISHWDDIAFTPELFARYHKFLVYFYDNLSIQRDTVLANFCNWNHIKLGNYAPVYASPQTNEYVYELSDYQDNSAQMIRNYTETDFDFEKLTPDKSNFISADGKYFLKSSTPLSTSEHHSGNTSIVLNKQNPYTTIYRIKTSPGSLIYASVWRKADDTKSNIVFSSTTNGTFYSSGEASADSGAQGWKQIEYSCRVPAYIKDSSAVVYLYYYGQGQAYFDDLSIKVYPMQLHHFTFSQKDSVVEKKIL